MEFRIADTFTASLARLTAAEQKAVKTTAFDLQVGPSRPGLRFHRLDHAKDPNFWSVRVNDDLRIILHRLEQSLVLLYVDHHEAAYAWAERRRLERHPTTGAMQLVELRERVEGERPEGRRASAPGARFAPLATVTEEALAGWGVPADWIEPVRSVANEDELLALLPHLPQEAQEALLALAVGEQPRPIAPASAGTDPFLHPDAQRRFLLVGSIGELQRALDDPWDKWAVFLHPDQRALVERGYRGPVRVGGSAGTGKTVVALHRTAALARARSEARILLATFSDALADSLRVKLRRLLPETELESGRIRVDSLHAVARELHARTQGEPRLAEEAVIASLVEESARSEPGHRFPLRFLIAEWRDVVDARQLASWEAYRDAPRLGRKTRLPEGQRARVWRILERVHAALAAQGLLTWPMLLARLVRRLEEGEPPPFEHVIVDECQDLGIAEARWLAAIAAGRPDGLFLTGDLGQRIFQQPFSWKAVGIDVRGRSFTLRVNYRTSRQIRERADRLLPAEIADVDGLGERRRGTVSLFEGRPIEVHRFADERAEIEAVASWLRRRSTDGASAVFVRSEQELGRALAAVERAGRRAALLGGRGQPEGDAVAVGTMHLAKGLEFQAVAVMACDEEVLPSSARIAAVGDEADLEEVYDTERHLLYVACTRARDDLWVSGVEPGSEFLADLLASPPSTAAVSCP